jgi:DUF1680 family protein
VIADEIELSLLNSVLGMHSSSGRWATYNTPMDGIRRASAHTIVFQAREGSPELNCCSVNSPRGLGMLSDWALMGDGDGLIVNYYGPSTMTIGGDASPGSPVTLTQLTDYPASGRIVLRVEPEQACTFALKLRIPTWSGESAAHVNGEPVPGVTAGQYLCLQRTWQAGDTVTLDLDMSPHCWAGEGECAGWTSIYCGPILLTFDHRYNLTLAQDRLPVVRQYDRGNLSADTLLDVPALDARAMAGRLVEWKEWLPPWLLFEVEAQDGQMVRLCDYASAGEAGTPYRSWLPVANGPQVLAFSRQNPLRSGRL